MGNQTAIKNGIFSILLTYTLPMKNNSQRLENVTRLWQVSQDIEKLKKGWPGLRMRLQR